MWVVMTVAAVLERTAGLAIGRGTLRFGGAALAAFLAMVLVLGTEPLTSIPNADIGSTLLGASFVVFIGSASFFSNIFRITMPQSVAPALANRRG